MLKQLLQWGHPNIRTPLAQGTKYEKNTLRKCEHVQWLPFLQMGEATNIHQAEMVPIHARAVIQQRKLTVRCGKPP